MTEVHHKRSKKSHQRQRTKQRKRLYATKQMKTMKLYCSGMASTALFVLSKTVVLGLKGTETKTSDPQELPHFLLRHKLAVQACNWEGGSCGKDQSCCSPTICEQSTCCGPASWQCGPGQPCFKGMKCQRGTCTHLQRSSFDWHSYARYP